MLQLYHLLVDIPKQDLYHIWQRDSFQIIQLPSISQNKIFIIFGRGIHFKLYNYLRYPKTRSLSYLAEGFISNYTTTFRKNLTKKYCENSEILKLLQSINLNEHFITSERIIY
jgi:hypothetical protein